MNRLPATADLQVSRNRLHVLNQIQLKLRFRFRKKPSLFSVRALQISIQIQRSISGENPPLFALELRFTLLEKGAAAFAVVGTVEAALGGVLDRLCATVEAVAGGMVDRELACFE